MSRAEYMREYRAKRKAKGMIVEVGSALDLLALETENVRLTEEVARLKRELAARAVVGTERWVIPDGPYAGQTAPIDPSFTAFRPAPKPGRK